MKKKIIISFLCVLAVVLMLGLSAFAAVEDETASLSDNPAAETSVEGNSSVEEMNDTIIEESPSDEYYVETENLIDADNQEKNNPRDSEDVINDAPDVGENGSETNLNIPSQNSDEETDYDKDEEYPSDVNCGENEVNEEGPDTEDADNVNNINGSDEEDLNKTHGNSEEAVVETSISPNENVRQNEQKKTGANYYLTICTADGKSIDVPGGAETDISDVLRALDFDVDENSEITFDPDSVDTNVIGLTLNESGKVVLTDNGHFEKASKNLVVYVNGEAIELIVFDDNSFFVDTTNGKDDDTYNGSEAEPYKTIGKAISKAGTEKTTIKLLTDIIENITIGSDQVITLDLNGFTLKGTGSGSVIHTSGAFTLEDTSTDGTGKVTGGIGTKNSYEYDGGGVYVSGGTFTMKRGNISGNECNETDPDKVYTSNGGGVYVSSGTFTMDGGAITENIANDGAGVYIAENASFIMNGGSIFQNNTKLEIENHGSRGGGVFIGYNSEWGSGITSDSKNASFIMNNGTISENTAKYGGGVYINYYANFTMKNGTISKNKATYFGKYSEGGGVYNYGTFTMEDGSISENLAQSGGGVKNRNEHTFIMKDGLISKNTAIAAGGGVANSGTFEMTDGTISYNTAEKDIGGGVYNYETFTMTGGTISDNFTGSEGGGVYNYGVFTITNGTISGNTSKSYGGGVSINHYYNTSIKPSSLTVGKSANISGNKRKIADDTLIDNNVYILSDSVITIATGTDAPTDDMKVGVTLQNGNGTVTSGEDTVNKDHFTSDNILYGVIDDVNESVHYVKLIERTQLTVSGTEIIQSKCYDGTTSAGITSIGSLDSVPVGIEVSLSGATATYENADVGDNKNVTVNYSLTGADAYKYYVQPFSAKANITAKSGNSNTMSGVVDVLYSGNPQIPTITVYDGTTVVDEKNYDIEYKDNTNVGTAKVVVKFKQNYSGSIEKTFIIEEATASLNYGENTTYYRTVQEAFDTARSKIGYGTIEMRLDSEENIVIPNGDYNLNLHGHTLSASSGTVVKNNGAITLTDSVGGGKITGGDIGVEQNKALLLAGSVSVLGNKKNIYLPSGKTVSVENSFNGTVGITTETTPEYGSSIDITETTSGDFSTCFLSDNYEYKVQSVDLGGNNKKVVLVAKTKIALPEAVNLTYNGEVQTGVKDSVYYTVSSNSSTNAGDYEAVAVLKDKDNYVWDLSNITADDQTISWSISPKQLTVKGTVVNNKTYDGTSDATAIVGDVSGIISGDDITVGVLKALFEDADIATGKNVSVEYVISGKDALNYIKPEMEMLTADIYPIPSPTGIELSDVVSTDDENCTAKCSCSGTTASIFNVDRDGNKLDVCSLKILKPEALLANGVKTAEIRLYKSLLLIIDIKQAMCEKSKCVITINNNNGIIEVACDGSQIFAADINDIIDVVTKVVYDGQTVKAYDADGNVIKEFNVI